MPDEEKKEKKESLGTGQIVILSFIVAGLAGLLGYFIYDSTNLIGNCKNNVPTENCNKPAGDFAVEPNTSSTSVLTGCQTESGNCNFSASSLNDAIKQCNSLGNKCNRFIYNNKTMSVVATTGTTSPSEGTNMFIRQNGVTYQGQGNPSGSYKTSNVTGENTSVTQDTGTTVSGTGTVATSTGGT